VSEKSIEAMGDVIASLLSDYIAQCPEEKRNEAAEEVAGTLFAMIILLYNDMYGAKGKQRLEKRALLALELWDEIGKDVS